MVRTSMSSSGECQPANVIIPAFECYFDVSVRAHLFGGKNGRELCADDFQSFNELSGEVILVRWLDVAERRGSGDTHSARNTDVTSCPH